VAVTVAALTALPSAWTKHGADGLILIYSVVERSVMVVSLIILAGLQVVIVRYRLELPKNTMIYSFTYAFYFTARAIQAYLLAILGPDVSGIVNSVGMLVDIACLLALIVLLSRSGMEVKSLPGPRLSRNELERLQIQMSTLNEIATRIRPWGGSRKD
jgi:hypothetical protein